MCLLNRLNYFDTWWRTVKLIAKLFEIVLHFYKNLISTFWILLLKHCYYLLTGGEISLLYFSGFYFKIVILVIKVCILSLLLSASINFVLIFLVFNNNYLLISSIVLGFFYPTSQVQRTDVTAFCMQLRNWLQSSWH